MGFKHAVRNWANAPTRAEKVEIKHKEELLTQHLFNEEQRKRDVLVEASKESAQVRALRKQLILMEELLDKSYNQIKEQSDIISNHKEGDWMDKLVDKGLDVADNIFNPSKKPINITPKNQKPSTSNTETTSTAIADKSPVVEGYSSEEVIDFVNSMNQIKLNIASNYTYDKFSAIIKKNAPEVSNENILQAFELVKERTTNGKKE